MKTNVDLDAISDGKLYGLKDLVRADTGGCRNCSACCHGVGELVELNPYDVWVLQRHLDMGLDRLLESRLQLRLENRLLLPYLRMVGEDERCSFLNEQGWCDIHSARPDICRLFPLGRVYAQDDFSFFLQTGVCVKPKLEKIKVKKWIGIENYEPNKAFILAWYQLKKALDFRLRFVREEGALAALRTEVLDTFYRLPPETPDFYEAFHRCLPAAKERLGVL